MTSKVTKLIIASSAETKGTAKEIYGLLQRSDDGAYTELLQKLSAYLRAEPGSEGQKLALEIKKSVTLDQQRRNLQAINDHVDLPIEDVAAAAEDVFAILDTQKRQIRQLDEENQRLARELRAEQQQRQEEARALGQQLREVTLRLDVLESQ